jgi:hypothetical protein
MGVLLAAEGGKVCFTRSADEAAYWALLPRNNDEGCGAILIFDRQLLQCRFKIEPYHDPFWDTDASRRDEAEEGIWADVTNIGRYLIGFVSVPTTKLSDLHKMRNLEQRINMGARLNELLYFVPEWRHMPEELIKSKLASMRRPAASPGSSA